MTLRKCIFDIENYSERGLRIGEPPLKLSTSLGITTSGAFYISTRMNARTMMYHCKKRPYIESLQI